MSEQPPSWGEQPGPPVREISRRNFLRQAVGVGVGLLTLQFLGGTILFLWPNLRGGLGDPNLVIGSAQDIATQQAWECALGTGAEPGLVGRISR